MLNLIILSYFSNEEEDGSLNFFIFIDNTRFEFIVFNIGLRFEIIEYVKKVMTDYVMYYGYDIKF